MGTFMLWFIGDPIFLNFEAFGFDAVVSQDHSKSLTMLKHPAEKGIEITDHLKTEPDLLSLSGIITNTVVAIGAPLIYDSDRAEQIDAKLMGLFALKVPVTIVTSLRVYTDIILKTYKVTRAVDKSNGIFCDLSFEQLRIVESQTTLAPELKKRTRAGRKATKPVSSATEEKSSIIKLLLG